MRLIDFVFPPACPICSGLRFPWEEECCPGCRKQLKEAGENTCYYCGRPVEENEEFCSRCKKRRPTYEQGFSVFLYEGALKESLMGFKFRGREWNGRFYAEEILRVHGKSLTSFGAEAVIPVPIHRRKLRKRGYNQAEVIAKSVAGRLLLPCRCNLLYRRRFTRPQKELGEVERLRNLMDAFALRMGKRKTRTIPKSIILVDDILTTGSTLEACSRILKKAGVERIAAVTVCCGSGY